MMSVSRYITRTHWLVQQRACELVTAFNAHIKAGEKDAGWAAVCGGFGLFFGFIAIGDGGTLAMGVSSLVGFAGAGANAALSLDELKLLRTKAPFARLCKKTSFLTKLNYPPYDEAWENLTERLPPLAADASVEEEALKLIAAVNRDVEL
jgi:hypothetical protein